MLSASLPFKFFQSKNKESFEVKNGKIFGKKLKFIQIHSNTDFLLTINKLGIQDNPLYISEQYTSDLQKLITSSDSLEVLEEIIPAPTAHTLYNQFYLTNLDFYAVKNENFNDNNQDPFIIEEINGFLVDINVNNYIQPAQENSISQNVNKGKTNMVVDQLYVTNKYDNLNLKVVEAGGYNYVKNEKVSVTDQNNNGGGTGSTGQYKEFWA